MRLSACQGVQEVIERKTDQTHSASRKPASEKIFDALAKVAENKFTWLAPLIVFLVIFMFVPLLYMFVYSFYSMKGYVTIYEFTLDNYRNIFFDPNSIYLLMLGKSIIFSGTVTLICLALGYPIAYYIVKEVKKSENKLLLTLLFAVPFFAGELIRIYTISHFLGPRGLINKFLMAVGLQPLEVFNFTDYSVLITLTYVEVAFMTIAIYLSLINMNFNLIDVAKSYGASSFRAFREVTWPLSSTGVFVGVIVVFVPMLAHYLSTTFVGGPNSSLFGNIVVHQFQAAAAWTMGSALATVLVAVGLIIVVILYKLLVRFKEGFWI